MSIETTFKKGNTTYFLVDDAIVGLEDGVKMAVPDAIYLQRISHRTKTFDMVCFYGKKYSVFSAIDKSSWRPYVNGFRVRCPLWRRSAALCEP